MSGDGDEFTLPPRAPRSTSRGKDPGAGERTFSGVLGYEGIEGGCAFVEAADGSRYEVVFPEGWAIDRSSGELRGGDGRNVRAGDAITIRGSVATDRSSICQIGPIIIAREVILADR